MIATLKYFLHPRRHFYFIPQIAALCIAGPLAWMAFDRKPPLILHDGSIMPNTVSRGETGVSLVWRAHFSGRDCPGYTQREIVDSKRNLWPFLTRERRGHFVPDVDNRNEGTVFTPPLAIPDGIAAGTANYKVTNIYYCNALQRWLRWPIVVQSPYITFEVAP